jgi:hypothetical protein
VVLSEISNDHNIIELDLDMGTDRRQAKLKRPTYNLGRAGKATRRTNKNGTIKPFQKFERSHDRIYKLDNQGLR